MISKTFGGSPTTPKNTRDDLTYGKVQPPNVRPKSKGGDAAYHLNGRPWTRPGNETDKVGMQ